MEHNLTYIVSYDIYLLVLNHLKNKITYIFVKSKDSIWDRYKSDIPSRFDGNYRINKRL